MRKKYGGEGERFGPTLAAEHLQQDDDVVSRDATRVDVGGRDMEPGAERGAHRSGGNGRRTLGSWCNWMEVSTSGWKGEARGVV